MTPHPADDAMMDLTRAITTLTTLPHTDKEQELYEQIAASLRALGQYRRRACAADAYARNGATRWVASLFADAGDTLVWHRTVVPFPDRHEKQTA